LSGDGGAPEGCCEVNMWRLILINTLVAAACTRSTQELPDATATVDAAEPLLSPFIPDHGGPVLEKPSIITVTWAGDALVPGIEAFDAWLPQSDFWTSSLGQYRVMAGAQTSTAHVATPAPVRLDDANLKVLLRDAIEGGTIAGPQGNTVYAVYAPSGTTITETFGGYVYSSCVDFLGYHALASLTDGTPIYYAVVPRCPAAPPFTLLDTMTWYASHELAETATDPDITNNAWVLLPSDHPDPNFAPYGGEIGDLCAGHPINVDGHVVTALYSNSAAATRQRPCVPAPAGPMFRATGTPTELAVGAGQSVMSSVAIVSTDPAETGLTFHVYTADPKVKVTSSSTNVKPGDQLSVSVSLASNAPVSERLVEMELDSADYTTITYLIANP
jgi:hypothetical protein